MARNNRKARRAHLQPVPTDIESSNMAAIGAWTVVNEWRTDAWAAEYGRQLEMLKRAYTDWKDHTKRAGWKVQRVPW